MMRKHFLIFLLLATVSCKKQPAVCTGNCETINVNGYLFNNVTNTNATVAPVSLDWVKFTALISNRKNISVIQSKNDGTFDFSSNIDTTMFGQGYFLDLRVANNDSYMTLADNGTNNKRMYEYSPNGFTNLRLEVYPKTVLKINLNRTQNDNLKYLQIAYYFVDNAEFLPFETLSPGDINKTELDVPTSTDLYTKIRVTKTDSAGISTTTIDSIRCTNNGTNSYTINF
jgi:hypothetical protein